MAVEKIFLIYADYQQSEVPTPYAVRKRTRGDAKKYFQKKYPWLKIFSIKEYTDDPAYLGWFYKEC